MPLHATRCKEPKTRDTDISDNKSCPTLRGGKLTLWRVNDFSRNSEALSLRHLESLTVKMARKNGDLDQLEKGASRIFPPCSFPFAF